MVVIYQTLIYSTSFTELFSGIVTDQKIEEKGIEIWNTKIIEEADRDHGNLIDMKEGTFIKIVLIKIGRPLICSNIFI